MLEMGKKYYVLVWNAYYEAKFVRENDMSYVLRTSRGDIVLHKRHAILMFMGENPPEYINPQASKWAWEAKVFDNQLGALLEIGIFYAKGRHIARSPWEWDKCLRYAIKVAPDKLF